jgi:hypothetical protein
MAQKNYLLGTVFYFNDSDPQELAKKVNNFLDCAADEYSPRTNHDTGFVYQEALGGPTFGKDKNGADAWVQAIGSYEKR